VLLVVLVNCQTILSTAAAALGHPRVLANSRDADLSPEDEVPDEV